MNLGGTIRLNRTGICIIIGISILIILYMSSNKKEDINIAKNEQVISLRKLLYSAIQSAEHGGRAIRNIKGPLDIKIKGKTKEGANDSVTNADFKSNCVMYGSLRDTFPQLQIVSEEKDRTGCDEKQLTVDFSGLDKFKAVADVIVPMDQVTVWIDPLDATKEYTENKLQYITTMVCVAVQGKPIIGVIHKPFIEKTSFAWVGKIKSDDLHKPPENSPENPTVIISISHPGEVTKLIKKAYGEDVKIIQAAGAGYKVLEVIAGNATVYYHTTLIKKWDICAGNAVLNALGGKMTTSDNNEIDYSMMGTGQSFNDKGLIATIYNHDAYVGKLGDQKI